MFLALLSSRAPGKPPEGAAAAQSSARLLFPGHQGCEGWTALPAGLTPKLGPSLLPHEFPA